MTLAAIPITGFYAGVLGLLAVALANQVLWARINGFARLEARHDHACTGELR